MVEENPSAVTELPAQPEDSAPGPSRSAPAEDQSPPIPETVSLNEFLRMPVKELYDLGTKLGLRIGGVRSRHQLVFEILCHYSRKGSVINATGILDITRDGFGLIRDPLFNFAPFQDDVFIAIPVVRRFNLRPGLEITVTARAPRDPREKCLCSDQIVAIEGVPAADWQPPLHFDKLTALFPSERIILENPSTRSVGPRVVDIVSPLGKGQRGLICAPPRGGKTVLLKEIAASIRRNHPEIELIVLLINERPEEVTDFRETVDCQVFSSTFDEAASRHIQVSELVLERGKRLVEKGRDVVILLDSLTRLARGYNSTQGGKGPSGSGGVDHNALQKVRKFFGSARKVEEGGSLTILATALIETDSRMDEVIFEEFKGTGNLEIQLDRELVERRIYPAIHVQKSGTRKDDLLYHPDEFRRISAIRRQMAQMPAGEALETLIRSIKATATNAELLLTGLRQ
jgi:transcription termination factor Rho